MKDVIRVQRESWTHMIYWFSNQKLIWPFRMKKLKYFGTLKTSRILESWIHLFYGFKGVFFSDINAIQFSMEMEYFKCQTNPISNNFIEMRPNANIELFIWFDSREGSSKFKNNIEITATWDRSFDKLNLFDLYHCSSLGQGRFSKMSILDVEK